jgi:thiol:disulfide interchange protein
MELLLNLVWLVAALLVAAAAWTRAKSETSGNQFWLLAVAVICLWVVLFPAISMTDDLQQVIFASEENPQSLLLSDIHRQTTATPQLLSVLALLSLLPAFLIASRDFLSRSFVVPPPLEGFLRPVISRPPPSPLF